jgi:hypothetical protein
MWKVRQGALENRLPLADVSLQHFGTGTSGVLVSQSSVAFGKVLMRSLLHALNQAQNSTSPHYTNSQAQRPRSVDTHVLSSHCFCQVF